MKSIRYIISNTTKDFRALHDFFEVADQKSAGSATQGTPTTDSTAILSPEMALMQDI